MNFIFWEGYFFRKYLAYAYKVLTKLEQYCIAECSNCTPQLQAENIVGHHASLYTANSAYTYMLMEYTTTALKLALLPHKRSTDEQQQQKKPFPVPPPLFFILRSPGILLCTHIRYKQNHSFIFLLLHFQSRFRSWVHGSHCSNYHGFSSSLCFVGTMCFSFNLFWLCFAYRSNWLRRAFKW